MALRVSSITILILIVVFGTSDLTGQIGGVTAGRINSISAAPITVHSAEFEPNYGFTSSQSQWDESSKLTSLYSSPDSLLIKTSFSLRIAYGLSDKIEVGTFISPEFSNWSLKYLIDQIGKTQIGLIGGINIPYGNTIVKKGARTADQTLSYGLGIASTVLLNERTAIELNIQHQGYFSDFDPDIPNRDLFFYMDYGQYISNNNIQLLASISFQESKFATYSSTVFSIYPGVSLEMKDNFLIVVNGAFDLFGKNASKTKGFALAWTMLF